MATEGFSGTYITPAVSHLGPAGKSYKEVDGAGEATTVKYCDNYPDTENSQLIPPLVLPKYPDGPEKYVNEPADEKERQKKENRYRGFRVNQRGEAAEHKVFLVLDNLRKQPLQHPILVIRNFSLQCHRKPLNTKVRVLEADPSLPGLDLRSIVPGEHDVFIFVRNIGMILMEIKGSKSDANLRSAEYQLNFGETFIRKLMDSIQGQTSSDFPIIRLIVVPGDAETTSFSETSEGSYLIFQDALDNFLCKWTELVERLLMIKTNMASVFTDAHFKKLVHVVVGTWCMQLHPDRKEKYQYLYLDAEANVSHLMPRIDALVSQQIVSVDERTQKTEAKKSDPLTNITRADPSKTFRTASHINILYLQPMQKEIYENHKHAIIRGHGGSGKTILLLHKTLDIVHKDPNAKILIVAADPHTLRIKNILQSNNVDSDIIEEFPTSSQPTGKNVVIFNSRMFFKVEQETLMKYNLVGYHIFMDDLQFVYQCDYHTLGDFIEHWYKMCLQHNTFCWYLIDVMQGLVGRKGEEYSKNPHSLFLTRDHQPRTYNIPVLHLTGVMRSTADIIKLINEARKNYIDDASIATETDISPHTLPTPTTGHKITGHMATCHQLKLNSTEEQRTSFIVDRLREELKTLCKPPHGLLLSSVAILYALEKDLRPYKSSIETLLVDEFNTTPQTIEQQLTSNNTKDIIMDSWGEVQSFESMAVIYIRVVGDSTVDYHYCGRARVHLTIINVPIKQRDCLQYKNVDMVQWKPLTDNTFTKYLPDDKGSESESEGKNSSEQIDAVNMTEEIDYSIKSNIAEGIGINEHDETVEDEEDESSQWNCMCCIPRNFRF